MLVSKPSFPILKVGAGFLALFASVVSGVIIYRLSMFGYPDGHLTEFERAVFIPLKSVTVLHAVFALYFLFLYFKSISHRLSRKMVMRSGFIYMLLVCFTFGAIPWYFGRFLRLDQGGGG